MLAPGLDDDLGLGEAVEDFAVEQLVAELGVEALAVAVLPRAARFDVGGLRADGGDPVPHCRGDKLGAVVGSYVAGRPSEGVSQKTHRGLEGRIAKGKSAGGLSYGYRLGADASGARLMGELEIDQAEALIVRRIFEEYAAGRSPLKIAAALNAEGVPAPRHKAEKPKFWKQNTIDGNRQRGTGILNNELYIGKRVWNRLRYSKHPTTDKRVSRLRNPAEWRRHDAPGLRIVDDELWQAVKARQDRQTKERAEKPATDRNGLSASQSLRRRRYLLSGLLACGKCGGSLTIAGSGRRKRYYCANAKEKGPAVCAGMPGLLQDVGEQTVLRGLRRQLMEDSAYQAFQRRFREHLEESTNGRDDEIEAVERLIRAKEREDSGFFEAIARGSVSEALIARLNEVESSSSACGPSGRLWSRCPSLCPTTCRNSTGAMSRTWWPRSRARR